MAARNNEKMYETTITITLRSNLTPRISERGKQYINCYVPELSQSVQLYSVRDKELLEKLDWKEAEVQQAARNGFDFSKLRH